MPDPQPYSHALLVTGARTWDDEPTMRKAFNDLWNAWLPSRVTHPLLISGHARDGADAMAERIWRAAGFEVLAMPADWSAGRAAGVTRNQAMVDRAVALKEAGVSVACMAFLDLCAKDACARRGEQQLLPRTTGHFSHGTVHCRQRAKAAGVVVLDILRPGDHAPSTD